MIGKIKFSGRFDSSNFVKNSNNDVSFGMSALIKYGVPSRYNDYDHFNRNSLVKYGIPTPADNHGADVEDEELIVKYGIPNPSAGDRRTRPEGRHFPPTRVVKYAIPENRQSVMSDIEPATVTGADEPKKTSYFKRLILAIFGKDAK